MDKVFGRFQRYFSGGSGSNGMVTSSSSSNDDRDGSDIEEDFDDFSTERSRFGFGLLDRSYTPISTKDSRNQHGLDHKPGFFSKSSNRDHQKYYPTDSDRYVFVKVGLKEPRESGTLHVLMFSFGTCFK